MKKILHIALLMLLFAGLMRAGEILDRIVAIVNNTPILQSDWEIALRCEALLNSKDPESFTPDEQKAVFDRLVDQDLIREQMRGFTLTPITDREVQARVTEIRAQIEGAKTDEGWKRLLTKAGVSEKEIDEKIRTQMEIMRFLDARFRPTVRLDFRTIQNYYREQFLPELEKRGAQPVPLAEVAEKIREILTQRSMDQQISSWLHNLREQADIRIPSNHKNVEVTGQE